MTKNGPIDFKGKAFFSHALQGMKPHHLAARWNFLNYQGPTYSAILMEFTTPPSYGTTVIGVGGIAKEGEIITAGPNCGATHLKTKQDTENDWPEPTDIRFTWSGTTKDGKPVEAVIECAMGERVDRIDVMAEVPGFVKKIVANAAGTKPYIYQVSLQRCNHLECVSFLTSCAVFPPQYPYCAKAQDRGSRDYRRGTVVQRSNFHIRNGVIH